MEVADGASGRIGGSGSKGKREGASGAVVDEQATPEQILAEQTTGDVAAGEVRLGGQDRWEVPLKILARDRHAHGILIAFVGGQLGSFL